jgi:ketosteroid isomerase-like protein
MRSTKKVGAWALLVTLVATPALADPAAEATAHSKAFERAMNARDVQAALALYADDARVIFPGQGEEATGKAAIEKLLANVMAAFEGATTTLESQQVVPLAGGYTAVVGRWRIVFREPDGSTQTVHLRSSEVIRKDGERTLYVVDHDSLGVPPAEELAPAGPEATP